MALGVAARATQHPASTMFAIILEMEACLLKNGKADLKKMSMEIKMR